MIEPNKENWHHEVVEKARINHSAALADLIKIHRANLLSQFNTRVRNRYDHFDIFTLVNIMAQGYLDSHARDTIDALDPNLGDQLAQIYNLTQAALAKISKLQAPDTGKLKELLNYL
jgi:hypothetical protein